MLSRLTTTTKAFRRFNRSRFLTKQSEKSKLIRSMTSKFTAPYVILHSPYFSFRQQQQLPHRYIRLSSTYPYVTASISAGCVLFAADVSAQLLTNTTSVWDHKRTLSLSIFGFVYYGGPCKALYFLYDKVFSPKQFMMKAMIDCCVHTPFLLVPCFYYITGILKGDNVDNITSQLRKEWFVASTGSVAFWLPMQLICFRFVRFVSPSLSHSKKITTRRKHSGTPAQPHSIRHMLLLPSQNMALIFI